MAAAALPLLAEAGAAGGAAAGAGGAAAGGAAAGAGGGGAAAMASQFAGMMPGASDIPVLSGAHKALGVFAGAMGREGGEAFTGVAPTPEYMPYNFGKTSFVSDIPRRSAGRSMPQSYGPSGTYTPGRGYSGGAPQAQATQPTVGSDVVPSSRIQATHTPIREIGSGGGGGIIDVASRLA